MDSRNDFNSDQSIHSQVIPGGEATDPVQPIRTPELALSSKNPFISATEKNTAPEFTSSPPPATKFSPIPSNAQSEGNNAASGIALAQLDDINSGVDSCQSKDLNNGAKPSDPTVHHILDIENLPNSQVESASNVLKEKNEYKYGTQTSDDSAIEQTKAKEKKNLNQNFQSNNSLVLVTLHEETCDANKDVANMIAVPLGGRQGQQDTRNAPPVEYSKSNPNYCCSSISKCLFVTLTIILLVSILSLTAILAQVEHVTQLSTLGSPVYMGMVGSFTSLASVFVILTFGLIGVLVESRIIVYIYCILLFALQVGQIFLARIIRDMIGDHYNTVMNNWHSLPDAFKAIIQMTGKCCGDLMPLDDPVSNYCPYGSTTGCRFAYYEVVYSSQRILLHVFSVSFLLTLILCILSLVATSARGKTSV